MAKPIIVTWGGVQSSFDHEKLDRAKLYGKRQRQILDPYEQRCERAELSRDGTLLIRSGMTAQGYFDEGGAWVPNGDLVGLDADGNPLPRVPSTLGEPQELTGPVDPGELLDLSVRSVYTLDPNGLDPKLEAELRGGKVFRFPFCYRGGYDTELAYLVCNGGAFFALVGSPAVSEWCELQTTVSDDPGGDDDGDELDFEMF